MKLAFPSFKQKGHSSSPYESRLYRVHSPWRMRLTPVLTVLFASMITGFLPLLSSHPMLPQFGFMLFLAWRLLRPGVWAIWAGLPLGLFDDIFSGQPFGTAGLIWSLAMLILEIMDSKAIWRDYWQDWAIATVFIISSLFMGLWLVSLSHNHASAIILIPQIILSVLLYPMIARICAAFDRWRLAT